MPTYEYECDACGHRFERLQSMSDPAVRKCPKCAKLKVRRLISGGAGFIFKGSGFYETDYKRNRGGAKPPKDDAPAAAESKPAESASKDSKDAKSAPESKTESKSDAKPSKPKDKK